MVNTFEFEHQLARHGYWSHAAKIVRSLGPSTHREIVRAAFVKLFADDPHFDADHFLTCCNPGES